MGNRQLCNYDDQPWVYKAAHPLVFIVYFSFLLDITGNKHLLNGPQPPYAGGNYPTSFITPQYISVPFRFLITDSFIGSFVGLPTVFSPFSGTNRRSVTPLPSHITDGARPLPLSRILLSSLHSSLLPLIKVQII